MGAAEAAVVGIAVTAAIASDTAGMCHVRACMGSTGSGCKGATSSFRCRNVALRHNFIQSFIQGVKEFRIVSPTERKPTKLVVIYAIKCVAASAQVTV